LKTHGNVIAVERQPIIQFLRPFTGEEDHDRRAVLKKFRAVTPATILGIGERDTGSREFRPSSAMRAFWAAVSLVNGGSGRRDMLASDVREAANL
jgi:hypothetical protein